MSHTPLSKLNKYPEIPIEHITHEFFETPSAPILSLINNIPTPIQWSKAKVLDVGAGRGSIGRTIRVQTGATVDSIEIRGDEEQILCAHSDHAWITDYLQWEPPEGYTPTIIISNPPFSRAVEVAEHSFHLFPQVPLVMLQRLDWMGSKKRSTFFNTHPVQALWVLSQRPCFLTHSTQRDVWTYAWFWWNIPTECHGIKSI
jgi:hypothetical protein